MSITADMAKSSNSYYVLASEVIWHNFCHILLIQAATGLASVQWGWINRFHPWGAEWQGYIAEEHVGEERLLPPSLESFISHIDYHIFTLYLRLN